MAARYSDWFAQNDVISKMKALQIYPADGDLSLDGSSLQALFEEQCSIGADAIKADFERRTGRKPFLATRGIIRHNATTPDGLLILKTTATQIYSVKVNEETISDSTYWTLPEMAGITGEPIDALQFSQNYFGGRVWTKPQQIIIDADWGYCTELPPDVWAAGLNMATLYALTAIQGEQDMGSISEDGFSMGFDLVGPIDDKVRKDMWPQEWKHIIRRYTRAVV